VFVGVLLSEHKAVVSIEDELSDGESMVRRGFHDV
jgi:hypothetical protein